MASARIVIAVTHGRDRDHCFSIGIELSYGCLVGNNQVRSQEVLVEVSRIVLELILRKK